MGWAAVKSVASVSTNEAAPATGQLRGAQQSGSGGVGARPVVNDCMEMSSTQPPACKIRAGAADQCTVWEVNKAGAARAPPPSCGWLAHCMPYLVPVCEGGLPGLSVRHCRAVWGPLCPRLRETAARRTPSRWAQGPKPAPSRRPHLPCADADLDVRSTCVTTCAAKSMHHSRQLCRPPEWLATTNIYPVSGGCILAENGENGDARGLGPL